MKAHYRIISLVPSQTELLFDLGLEEQIVGVTKFCIHPTEAKQKKVIVGGTKNVKIDKIKSLKPNIILCNKEENTKEIVEACEQICKVHVSDIFNLQDAKELILEYGILFDKKLEAQKITKRIDKELHNFSIFIKDKPTLKIAYFIWRAPWMVAASRTFIHFLLELNGFENIFKNKERYPEINLDEVVDRSPDLILLSSEPYPFKEKHQLEIKELIPNTKVILVDGEMFSWYGSRLIRAFDYFTSLRKTLA